MAALKPGKPALLKYQPVRFSPFAVQGGASLALAADPWAYLQAKLEARRAGSRGKNLKRLERAIYYVDLGLSFFRASLSSPTPANCTLAYYSMLNLVKALLSSSGTELESVIEHHGLHVPVDMTGTIRVSPHCNDGVNIFHEFAALLGTPVTGKRDFKFSHACSRIPELHEIAVGIGVCKKRSMLPVEVDFLVNESATQLFTEIRYLKKNSARLKTERFFTGARKKYFSAAIERDGWVVHRSQKKKTLRAKDWSRQYRAVLDEYKEFGLASLLTGMATDSTATLMQMDCITSA